MVPGKELRVEILASCTWRNRLLGESVSSLRQEVCEQRLNGHVSVREAAERVPGLEEKFMQPQGIALSGISSTDGKYTDLELSPFSPVPPMADITGPSWCPAEPKCHLRNLPRASLLIEVAHEINPLAYRNPVVSFLQVRTLRARGAH